MNTTHLDVLINSLLCFTLKSTPFITFKLWGLMLVKQTPKTSHQLLRVFTGSSLTNVSHFAPKHSN